jgi:hypothetical protein
MRQSIKERGFAQSLTLSLVPVGSDQAAKAGLPFTNFVPSIALIHCLQNDLGVTVFCIEHIVARSPYMLKAGLDHPYRLVVGEPHIE